MTSAHDLMAAEPFALQDQCPLLVIGRLRRLRNLLCLSSSTQLSDSSDPLLLV